MVTASPDSDPRPNPAEPPARVLHANLDQGELLARRRDCVGRALAFLAPGLIHWLGNSLFAIQGHVQMLALRGQQPDRAVGEILKGSQHAQHALELLRHLVAEDGGQIVQVGILLPRMCELLRIPVRDTGVRITYSHSSRESPAFAAATLLCLAVTQVVQAFCQRLQPGFRGELEIDLTRQADWAEIRFQLRQAPDLLPFPHPAASMAAGLEVGLAELGARLRIGSDRQTLTLGLPVGYRRG